MCVLLFAAAVSLLSAFLFGLTPALQSTRTGLAGAIKNDAPSQKLRRLNLTRYSRHRPGGPFGSLAGWQPSGSAQLEHALSLNFGFEPEHAAVLPLDLAGQGYDEQRSRESQRRLLEEVRTMPGIQVAAIVSGLPLTATGNLSDVIYLEGQPEPRPGESRCASLFAITPGYLVAMHTRLMAGRDWIARDKPDSHRWLRS